ncbi:MAG: M15 family metallopeptidase [Gammaproteobacteria bacterium]|nr:M15 family metallopeptidase [Gammaproteobacteria bacterium]
MPNTLQHLAHLVDVIALSRKECERPIKAHLTYATRDNFIGQVINGYTEGLTDFALMTKNAAAALCKVQDDLIEQHNISLLIYDSYRPKKAVKHFMRWSSEPVPVDHNGEHELKRKNIHYPHIEKDQLFNLGYVAEDSQHCYGHTVDLVLIDKNEKELDLGACFDYMDPLSHITVTADEIGEAAHKHRTLLRETMQKHGFIPYTKEFWHFSFQDKLIKEPIDITISKTLKALNVV